MTLNKLYAASIRSISRLANEGESATVIQRNLGKLLQDGQLDDNSYSILSTIFGNKALVSSDLISEGISEYTYDKFDYWFTRSNKDRYTWLIYSANNNKYTNHRLVEHEGKAVIIPDSEHVGPIDVHEALSDFDKFVTRIEYFVGTKLPVRKDPKLIEFGYLFVLYGTFLISSCHDKSNSGSACINWLMSTDFFNAPASTQFHESFVGGLAMHSLNVYNQIIDIITLPQFMSVSLNDAIVVALAHDWCKIDLYESYQRNVKNEITGQWDTVTAFKRNQKGICLGHGVSSMFLASKFIALKPEMALAIRWHQGRWNVCREEINELQMANEKCPIVHLLQFADQLAITEYCN